MLRQAKIRAPQDLKERAVSRLNMYPVDLIGAEGIIAGTVLGDDSRAILMHGKVLAGGLELIVRTNDALLTDAVMRHCQQAFST